MGVTALNADNQKDTANQAGSPADINVRWLCRVPSAAFDAQVSPTGWAVLAELSRLAVVHPSLSGWHGASVLDGLASGPSVRAAVRSLDERGLIQVDRSTSGRYVRRVRIAPQKWATVPLIEPRSLPALSVPFSAIPVLWAIGEAVLPHECRFGEVPTLTAWAAGGTATTGQVQAITKWSQSTVQRHLSALLAAGMVERTNPVDAVSPASWRPVWRLWATVAGRDVIDPVGRVEMSDSAVLAAVPEPRFPMLFGPPSPGATKDRGLPVVHGTKDRGSPTGVGTKDRGSHTITPFSNLVPPSENATCSDVPAVAGNGGVDEFVSLLTGWDAALSGRPCPRRFRSRLDDALSHGFASGLSLEFMASECSASRLPLDVHNVWALMVSRLADALENHDAGGEPLNQATRNERLLAKMSCDSRSERDAAKGGGGPASADAQAERPAPVDVSNHLDRFASGEHYRIPNGGHAMRVYMSTGVDPEPVAVIAARAGVSPYAVTDELSGLAHVGGVVETADGWRICTEAEADAKHEANKEAAAARKSSRAALKPRESTPRHRAPTRDEWLRENGRKRHRPPVGAVSGAAVEAVAS